jgi:hypothetical protein
MNESMQRQTSGKIKNFNYFFLYKIIFFLESWIDIERPSTITSSFANPGLSSSMHINQNLLLEAQKESSRAGSKSSRSDR